MVKSNQQLIELTTKIEDNSYTIKALPSRLAALTTDSWENYRKVKQSLPLDK